MKTNKDQKTMTKPLRTNLELREHMKTEKQRVKEQHRPQYKRN